MSAMDSCNDIAMLNGALKESRERKDDQKKKGCRLRSPEQSCVAALQSQFLETPWDLMVGSCRCLPQNPIRPIRLMTLGQCITESEAILMHGAPKERNERLLEIRSWRDDYPLRLPHSRILRSRSGAGNSTIDFESASNAAVGPSYAGGCDEWVPCKVL